MKKKQIKPFKPKTPAEYHLIQLLKAMCEHISNDGFSEWHEWAHKIGEKGKCPNSSPFIPFLREWIKVDRKVRFPIVLAGYEAYAKGIDPYLVVKAFRKPKKETHVPPS